MLTLSIIIIILGVILAALAIYGKITRSKALEKAPKDTIYFGASINLDNNMDGYLYLTPDILCFTCKLQQDIVINVKDILTIRPDTSINGMEIETKDGTIVYKVNKRKEWIKAIKDAKEKFEEI